MGLVIGIGLFLIVSFVIVMFIVTKGALLTDKFIDKLRNK